jgi:PAS domain S-box-containing protein
MQDTIRVLLVGKDEEDFKRIESMLAEADASRYRLDRAATRAEGLQRMKEPRYDALLLDCCLDEEGGVELLDRAVGSDPGIPVILLTGPGEDRAGREAMKAEASDYIEKGLICSQLLDRSIRHAIHDRLKNAESKNYRDTQQKLILDLTRRLEEKSERLETANLMLEAATAERVEVEEALRESELKYRNLIESTGIGYVMIDKEGIVLDASSEYVRLSGHSSIREIAGRSVLEWTASYDLERNAEEIARCLVQGKVRDLEIDYVDKDGKAIRVEVNGTLTRTRGGEVIICLIKDVSERKRMEIELHRAWDEAYDLLEAKVAERTADLAATNSYLENVFNNSPDIITIVDEHGKFIKWSRAAAETIGYSSDELRNKKAFELYRDKEELARMLADLRRYGLVKNYLIDMVKKNGEIVAVDVSITLLKDSAGRVIGSVSGARDLSPLKKANEELRKEVKRRISIEESLRESEATYRESEKRYRSLYQEFQALLDAIPDIVVLLTPDMKAIWANRAYLAVAGKESQPAAVVGQHCYEALYGFTERCSSCPAPDCLASGEPRTSINVTPMGTVYEVRLVPVKDEQGKIVKIINLGRDISKIRKAEEQLQQTYSEMEQVLGAIPSFLIGLTPENRVTRWNNAAETTFGIGSNAALGRPFERCGIRWNWEKILEAVSVCKLGDTSTKLHNIRFTQTNGKEGFLEVTFTPFDGAGERPAGMLLSGSDITERRILESQLVQAQKLESIGQLAAGIAHEINTPAQYVGDNIRFLQDSYGDLERIHDLYNELIGRVKSDGLVEDLVQRIEKAAEEVDFEYVKEEAPKAIRQSLEGMERISRIVLAMKEFSHPGGDDKKEIDLNKAIESTITVARNEWKYVAEMETDLDQSLPHVACLPGEFNQAVLNMIINAAHAIAEKNGNGDGQKGKISVSTRAMGDFVEIRIGDTGMGIPENIRSKVFDPFFTTKEVGKGTGQGLAISRSVIVDKHGGTIDFETEVGKGSTFIIRLPVQSTGSLKAAQ